MFSKPKGDILEAMVCIKEDTEKTTLPPIQHIKPKSYIVKIDFSLYPVHGSNKPTEK